MTFQMSTRCTGGRKGRQEPERRGRAEGKACGDLLTVASLLHKSQLAGRPVRRQSDGIQIVGP